MSHPPSHRRTRTSTRRSPCASVGGSEMSRSPSIPCWACPSCSPPSLCWRGSSRAANAGRCIPPASNHCRGASACKHETDPSRAHPTVPQPDSSGGAGAHLDLRLADLRLAVFFFGTFLPARRASDRPIAMACLRLLTLAPERPLLKVPRLRSCMALPTFFDAALLYFLAMIALALNCQCRTSF